MKEIDSTSRQTTLNRPLSTEVEFGPWRPRLPSDIVDEEHIHTTDAGVELVPAGVYPLPKPDSIPVLKPGTVFAVAGAVEKPATTSKQTQSPNFEVPNPTLESEVSHYSSPEPDTSGQNFPGTTSIANADVHMKPWSSKKHEKPRGRLRKGLGSYATKP